jgi:hypothetical protein
VPGAESNNGPSATSQHAKVPTVGSNNWMRSRTMGLGNAFQRTGESPKNDSNNEPVKSRWAKRREQQQQTPASPMWDADRDFTAHSLQISPQLRVRAPEDTHETLRKLSRVLSKSPSPSPKPELNSGIEKIPPSKSPTPPMLDEGSYVEIESPSPRVLMKDSDIRKDPERHSTATPDFDPEASPSQRNLNKDLNIEKDTKRRSTASTDVDPEERITAEAKLFELLDEPLPLTTPKVTGAYVETPHRPDIPESLPQSRPFAPESRPPLINTAKPASAAEDLRQLQLEAKFEDSTLDEFDAMLEVAAAEVQSQPVVPEGVSILDKHGEMGLPLSQKELERRFERLVLEKMYKRLNKTFTSIRDAAKGMERLEERVSSLPSPSESPTTGRSTSVTISDDQTIQINIKLSVPRLWISTPGNESMDRQGGIWENRRWRFTWFGLVLFLFGIWFAAESFMCGVYCHPKQSSRNTWQPSDPFFPWAIPTKLDQWTGEVFSTVASSTFETIEEILFGTRRRGANFFGPPQHYGGSDWWLGRDSPVGIVRPSGGAGDGSIFNDEIL